MSLGRSPTLVLVQINASLYQALTCGINDDFGLWLDHLLVERPRKKELLMSWEDSCSRLGILHMADAVVCRSSCCWSSIESVGLLSLRCRRRIYQSIFVILGQWLESMAVETALDAGQL